MKQVYLSLLLLMSGNAFGAEEASETSCFMIVTAILGPSKKDLSVSSIETNNEAENVKKRGSTTLSLTNPLRKVVSIDPSQVSIASGQTKPIVITLQSSVEGMCTAQFRIDDQGTLTYVPQEPRS